MKKAELDASIFEVVLADDWFCKTSDKKDYYSAHRVKPLEKAGYIVFDREHRNEYPKKPADNWTQLYYRPTEAGIKWWIQAQLEQCHERDAHGPEELLRAFDGKGAGCEVCLSTFFGRRSIFEALRDGLVEYVAKPDHPWSPGFTRHIVVRLTPKGYRFFAALPLPLDVALELAS